MTGFPLASAAATDLPERPLAAGPLAPECAIDREGGVPLALRPFQIVTPRLTPASTG